MLHNMFGRMLSILLAIIVVILFIGAGFSILTIRNNAIQTRMEALTAEAREIAYLASRASDSTLTYYLGLDDADEAYLQWKAARVYEEYGAYILIVDRSGSVKDNMSTALKDKVSAVESLSTEDVTDALREVLQGNEVQKRLSSDQGGEIFTVAVPWVQNGAVLGAVFIHTSAQVVEAEYKGIVFQVAVGFAVSALLSVLAAVFYTRRITRPLTGITKVAEAMSNGNFSVRAGADGVNEIKQMAASINVMADKLSKVEEGRREFVANVSHELRAPVTSVHSFVTGMLDGTIPEEEHKKYLQIVSDETIRMKKLISDLLQLSRMDDGAETLTCTDFDINEAIRRVIIGRMNDIDAARIQLHLDFDTEACFVHADADRIAQVLHNLVDNALKYLPVNGNLTISTILVHDKVAVTVTNDGAPILPQDRPHIFERFYRADKAHTVGKGTGLGLSICKRILALHGEDICLLPREDAVSFRFTLQPAAEEKMKEC